ncbi:MAG: hypothetical protein ACTH30_05310 [Leucobacter sp.]
MSDSVDTGSSSGEPAAHASARPRVTGPQPGAAVPEPVEELSPELRAQMFKPAIDTRHRAPAAPSPAEEGARPRAGVRAGLPVMYGRRSERLREAGGDLAPTPGTIGAAPSGYEIPIADRADLPSLAALNRRFAIAAFAGGVAVSALAVAGVWWVATQLL